jgi:hypothetical protein
VTTSTVKASATTSTAKTSGARPPPPPPPAASRPVTGSLVTPSIPTSSNVVLMQSLFADLWGSWVAASSPPNKAPPPSPPARTTKQPSPPVKKPTTPAVGRSMVVATLSGAQGVPGITAVGSGSAGDVQFQGFSHSQGTATTAYAGGGADSSSSSSSNGDGVASGGVQGPDPVVPLPVRPVIPTASAAVVFSRQALAAVVQQQQQQQVEEEEGTQSSPPVADPSQYGQPTASSWGQAPAVRALYRSQP